MDPDLAFIGDNDEMVDCEEGLDGSDGARASRNGFAAKATRFVGCSFETASNWLLGGRQIRNQKSAQNNWCGSTLNYDITVPVESEEEQDDQPEYESESSEDGNDEDDQEELSQSVEFEQ